jgi:hypothetical protein
MRRKEGTLVPFELSIIKTAEELLQQGNGEFHGFQIAKAMQSQGQTRFLSGYGTLYRALGRLELQGYLRSYWEDPKIAQEQKRPPRKLYHLTGKMMPVVSNSDPLNVPTIGALGRISL